MIHVYEYKRTNFRKNVYNMILSFIKIAKWVNVIIFINISY